MQVDKEHCKHCGKERDEPGMIYVVPLDEYYCDQECLDKA